MVSARFAFSVFATMLLAQIPSPLAELNPNGQLEGRPALSKHSCPAAQVSQVPGPTAAL